MLYSVPLTTHSRQIIGLTLYSAYIMFEVEDTIIFLISKSIF